MRSDRALLDELARLLDLKRSTSQTNTYWVHPDFPTMYNPVQVSQQALALALRTPGLRIDVRKRDESTMTFTRHTLPFVPDDESFNRAIVCLHIAYLGGRWQNQPEYDKERIHASHVMAPEHSEVRTPVSESRFYGVSECENCGYEWIQHPAGFFIDDELFDPCEAIDPT